jgi:heme/copper-type cytochrome/quinol oxidase subunit 2
MDWLFKVVFWITMVIFIAVELVLVYFAIKYRHRPEKKKGVFTHGNTRLEMIWTIIPAIILLWISLATKKVWDEYRFGNSDLKSEDRTHIMVVGQQFKWNFIYPGPDRMLGRYLAYPKPGDPQFAYKPADQAQREVNSALLANPLGQRIDARDAKDPGIDDDYVPNPGRPLIVPVNRPLEITLGSRDVLHSFFLPNFRVKLDAVPGMRGTIYFTATKQSTVTAPVESVPDDKIIWLDANTPKTFVYGNPPSYQLYDPNVVGAGTADPYTFDPNSVTAMQLRQKIGMPSASPTAAPVKQPWLQSMTMTLRQGAISRIHNRSGAKMNKDVKPVTATKEELDAEVAALRSDLKKMGVSELTYIEQPFEIVCEELCGEGHALMNGQMIVVSGEQYDSFINKRLPGTASSVAPTTRP